MQITGFTSATVVDMQVKETLSAKRLQIGTAFSVTPTNITIKNTVRYIMQDLHNVDAQQEL